MSRHGLFLSLLVPVFGLSGLAFGARPPFADALFDTVEDADHRVLADFDEDGFPDLLLMTDGSSTARLLKSRNGQFLPARVLDTGLSNETVVSADFNGDGHSDLAFAGPLKGHSNGSVVSILLGKGDGTFTNLSLVTAGTSTERIAAADFDNDLNVDLAISDPVVNGIQILLGAGDGTFAAPVTSATTVAVDELVASDFTGDGIPDLAARALVTHSTELLAGAGNGSFLTLAEYPMPGYVYDLDTADLNEDGISDLIAASSPGGTVVLLSQRGGNLAGASQVSASFPYDHVPVADLNGDGHLDIVVSPVDEAIRVQFGDGAGGFGSPVFSDGIGHTFVGLLRDMTRDGIPDAIVFGSEQSAGILRGNGDGTFSKSLPRFAGGSVPSAFAAGDFNRDGRSDLIVANTGSQDLSVFLGDSATLLGTETRIPIGAQPTGVLLGDFNGDKRLDLFITKRISVPQPLPPEIRFGTGTGAFGPPVQPALDGSSFAVGRLDKDRRDDLALVDVEGQSLITMISNGDGSFHKGAEFMLAGYYQSDSRGLAIGDTNNDGWGDVVVASSENYTLQSFLGSAGGGLTPGPLTDTSSPYPHSPRLADFNRDGKLDVVLGYEFVSSAQMLLGTGHGTFSGGAALPCELADRIETGDFNADGQSDILILGADLVLFRGNGDATFQPRLRFGLVNGAPGDFDGDGRLDHAGADPRFPDQIVVMRNVGGAPAP